MAVKNGAGVSGDSGAHGAIHYGAHITRRTHLLAHSYCPALLLEVVGATARIQGLAYAGGSVVCEPLTPFLSLLDTGDRQPEQVRLLHHEL